MPVVHHGDRTRIVQACVKSSCLWRNVYELCLTQNMRLDPKEVEFSKYLLTIGEGHAQVFPNIGDQVPEEFLVKSLEELVAKVFPNITAGYEDKYYPAHHAILTPKNESVDYINQHIMLLFPGKSFVYKSADSIAEDELSQSYPTEFLNSLTLSGLPPHEMVLKVGCPIMLLRNLHAGPGNGLCNGTQMIVVKLGHRVIEAEIANGVNKGKYV